MTCCPEEALAGGRQGEQLCAVETGRVPGAGRHCRALDGCRRGHCRDADAHRWFLGVPGDELFAVRSSGIDEDGAGESFAGIHETLLNVARADLANAIRHLPAIAQAPPGARVSTREGTLRNGQMGVLVQRMVKATVAGVAFTVNPVTGATDEVVINASWGLVKRSSAGESIPMNSSSRRRPARSGGGGSARRVPTRRSTQR
jgi:hypothetical protein